MSEKRISDLPLTTQSLNDYFEISRYKNSQWSSWKTPITAIRDRILNNPNITGTANITTTNITTSNITTANITTSNITNLYIPDAGKIYIGTGLDGQIYSSGDNIYFDNITPDKDIIFRGDDGGGIKNFLQIDTSFNSIYMLSNFQVQSVGNIINCQFPLATVGSINFCHNGTGDLSVYTNDGDITISSGTAGNDIIFNQSSFPSFEALRFIQSTAFIRIADAYKLTIGTGSDGQIYSSSDNLYIDNVTQDKDIYIRANDGGVTREFLKIDASENIMYLAANAQIIGTGDTIIFALKSGLTGNLNFQNYGTGAIQVTTTNGGLVLSTGGAGNDTIFSQNSIEALRIVQSSTFIRVTDAYKLTIGTGDDGQIYSSSDNVYFDNVTSDKDIIIRGNDGGAQKTIITLDMSAATDDTGAVGGSTTDAPIIFERNATFGSASYCLLIPTGANSYAFASKADRQAGMIFNSVSAYFGFTNTSGAEHIRISAASAGETYFRFYEQSAIAGAVGAEIFEINGAGFVEIHGPADVGQEILLLDQADIDKPFINFQGQAADDVTSPISTKTTSGATTGHVQIEINGTKAWFAVSTNNPS